jgi:Family of unknown function (DUF6130)
MIAHAGNADESLAIFMVFVALWVGWTGWSRLKGTGFPRLPRSAAFGLLGVAGVILVTSAVVPRALLGPKASAAPPSGPRPSSTATIAFRSPTPGQRVVGDELEVLLTLRGGTITEATTSAVTPDVGHIHLSLDGQLVSMTFGTVQVLDLRGVAPGRHTLQAEFVAADHAPFDPRVETTVTFIKGSG